MCTSKRWLAQTTIIRTAVSVCAAAAHQAQQCAKMHQHAAAGGAQLGPPAVGGIGAVDEQQRQRK